MIDLHQQIGIQDPWYVEATPFAKVGALALHFVRVPCESIQDQIVGIGLRPDRAGDRGVFVSLEELPLLADIVNGIVHRGKLGIR
jgi:hypothetical protein